MKRVLMILFVLGMLLVAGCAKESADSQTPSKPGDVKKVMPKPMPPAQTGGSAAAVTGEISESDMGDIDTFDADLDTSDVDSLDEDLNFEV